LGEDREAGFEPSEWKVILTMVDKKLVQLTDGNRPFLAATTFDLSSVGYIEAEYSFSGVACAYFRGKEAVRPSAEEAPFRTRLLVYRPADDAFFNGTVWVEWLNVSGGLDAAPDWVCAHTELVRRGAAWVGVSAQQIGVVGGASILGMNSAGLVGMDQARYGELSHPGDRFSYDIYEKATQAVRAAEGTILDGLPIERVLGIGESQSAFRLTTYINDIDPLSQVHDGFVVHARGGRSAPLDDESDPSEANDGQPVPFRTDLRVPVLCVQSETDLINLAYHTARQDDSESFVLWEMAGTSHADVYTFAAGMIDTGRLPIEELAVAWRPGNEVFGMKFDKPVNAGPQHYMVCAAVRALERWVTDGTRPPPSPKLAVHDGTILTDDKGIAIGGIRTASVDVPVAVLSGFGNSGNPLAFLAGSTTPFSSSLLRNLYSSNDEYLKRVASSTQMALESGFLLPEDVAEMIAIAAYNSPL
jgi:hypothetical protein